MTNHVTASSWWRRFGYELENSVLAALKAGEAGIEADEAGIEGFELYLEFAHVFLLTDSEGSDRALDSFRFAFEPVDSVGELMLTNDYGRITGDANPALPQPSCLSRLPEC